MIISYYIYHKFHWLYVPILEKYSGETNYKHHHLLKYKDHMFPPGGRLNTSEA